MTGAQFRELRNAYGLSLRKAAKDMGINAGYLSDYENGKRVPSHGILLQMEMYTRNVLKPTGRF